MAAQCTVQTLSRFLFYDDFTGYRVNVNLSPQRESVQFIMEKYSLCWLNVDDEVGSYVNMSDTKGIS